MIKYINSRRLNMRKSNKRKKKAINWKIFSRKLMVSFLIIAIAGLAGLIGVFAVAARDLPKWDPELLSGAKTTIIYDDKEEFAAGLHAGENRTEVSLDSVRLIHGKGTGALRNAVQKYLKTHPQVKAFRDGLPEEGGHGVTVVVFK
jgi:hypothetical protein